ncbi:unnamed protein product, partial [Trichogramma brassicae]
RTRCSCPNHGPADTSPLTDVVVENDGAAWRDNLSSRDGARQVSMTGSFRDGRIYALALPTVGAPYAARWARGARAAQQVQGLKKGGVKNKFFAYKGGITSKSRYV